MKGFSTAWTPVEAGREGGGGGWEVGGGWSTRVFFRVVPDLGLSCNAGFSLRPSA